MAKSKPSKAKESTPEESAPPLVDAASRRPVSDQGLSLDRLSSAFAEMLQSGDDPYQESAPADEEPPEALLPSDPIEAADDEACPLSPRSILEAMLFMGSPDNRPLSSEEVAGMMRGVRPAEIDQYVQELNAQYSHDGCPYEIISSGPGYRMVLRDAFAHVRNRFYGRPREAVLSQAAIEVLSLVAYRQPLTADEVDRQRGKPSRPILSQLLRRQLLRIERVADQPRAPRYHTTPRFLALFGLTSLRDLPQSQDLEAGPSGEATAET